MSRTWFAGGLVAALCIALGAFLYLTEWREREVPAGWSDEARRNPWLAAERFLDRLDIPVQQHRGLSLLDVGLPERNSVLVVGATLRSVSERRLEALTSWVDSGGRLVLLAGDLFREGTGSSGHALLDRFQVQVHEASPEDLASDQLGLGEASGEEASGESNEEPNEEANEEASEEETRKDRVERVLSELQLAVRACEQRYPNGSLTNVDFEGEQVTHRLGMRSDRYLSVPLDMDAAAAFSDAGAQLVAVQHGQGMIYFLTTLSMWSNANIGCFDHAHFLRWLGENRAGVHLLMDAEVDGLITLIWRHYAVAVTLLMAFVLLWLWRGALLDRRVVGAAADRPAVRTLSEQLRGMARFHWQQKESEHLVKSLQRQVLRRFEGQTPERRARWLEELALEVGLEAALLRWALEEDDAREAQDLKKAVQVLTRLGQHLNR